MSCQVACSVLPVYALFPTPVRFGCIDSSKQVSKRDGNSLLPRAGGLTTCVHARVGGGEDGWVPTDGKTQMEQQVKF